MSGVDDGTSVGYGFAFRGLNQLCKYHSTRDLKTFRTVSQAWNDAVSFHPRYRSAKVTLGARWFRQASALQLGHLTSWTNVKLYLFDYTRNIRFFPNVWKISGRDVTKLYLRKVKLSCTELNRFLNMCPALRSLTINDMEFADEMAGLVHPEGNDGGPPPVANRPAVYCSHIQHYQYPGPEPLLPPTIQHLRFEVMRYFPFCTLDYLAERCRGKLEKFEMESNPPPGQKLFRPSFMEIRTRLTRLISENTATLTSFTFFNNASGIEFLTDVGNEVPNLALIELILGTYMTPPPRRARNRDPPHHLPPILPWNFIAFMQLIQSQLTTRLRRLFLKTLYTAELMTWFTDIRATLANLEKLKVSFDGVEQGIVFNVDFLTNLQVTELNLMGTLEMEARNSSPWATSLVFPNCQYWLTLPETLRSLECAHKLSRNQNPTRTISQTLLSNRLKDLTKLVIRDARLFTDLMVQQIIEHLPQLQELTLRYGVKLSDSAFTGISLDVAKTLQECGSYSVLSGANDVIITAQSPSIRQLVHLRKLNLSGCTIVSDISCRYGFTNLLSIDLTECCRVSDMGLFWLGRNNPRLKEVHLRRNVKISHFGLNQFLFQLKSVTKVYTSSFLLNRQLGNSTYVQHPLFDEIACIASETQVQIAKYRREF